ncbi:integrase core domain-containing protein [Pantoea ananatis]|uniref:integrase core domain-containing protein n=1 Tax=Pantoea ananas TaxID=553 RepID=UPI0011A92176
MHGVDLYLIQPVKTAQNEFIKRFNGRFCDQRLNKDGLSIGFHNNKVMNNGCQDYNKCRPNSALTYQTRYEYEADWD